ncbi:hypothetical protein NDU88_005300 [Pleurodeles waltl]|uniref:Uncharacterized protein n=1 Tax=Pleurodeles waltl TaxID=8319 RepID=A0AAV7RNV2_PLEWA|nr:hypothetical protein NDU88_005300 [Pleurodeles waltl]
MIASSHTPGQSSLGVWGSTHSSQGPSISLAVNESCALRFTDAVRRLRAALHLSIAGIYWSARGDAGSHRLLGRVALERHGPICSTGRTLMVPGTLTQLYAARTAPSVSWSRAQPLRALVEWCESTGSCSRLHNDVRHSRLRRHTAVPQASPPRVPSRTNRSPLCLLDHTLIQPRPRHHQRLRVSGETCNLPKTIGARCFTGDFNRLGAGLQVMLPLRSPSWPYPSPVY